MGLTIIVCTLSETKKEESKERVQTKDIVITTQQAEEYTIVTVMDGDDVEFQYEGLSTVWYSKEQDKRYVTLNLEDAGVVK